MIPARTPMTKPAMKPPPIIRLKTANGSMITSARAPFPRTMTRELKINVRPIIIPIANAYVGPMAGSQKKMLDQLK